MTHHEQARFQGIERLYGRAGLEQLAAAHVLVVGIGGVGSWTAEALARSGIGALTLLDPDELCVTNINRQIHAIESTIGRPKVNVLAERIRQIHPGCRVEHLAEAFRLETMDRQLQPRYAFVVDAIDGVTPKAGLIAGCCERRIPVVSCGGAGGKIDPSLVQVCDLSKTSYDRLLFFVRKKLRSRFGFPSRGLFGVPCIYSPEPVRLPEGCAVEPPTEDPFGSGGMNCDGRLGSAAFVTGVIGLHAAALVCNRIAGVSAGPVAQVARTAAS